MTKGGPIEERERETHTHTDQKTYIRAGGARFRLHIQLSASRRGWLEKGRHTRIRHECRKHVRLRGEDESMSGR